MISVWRCMRNMEYLSDMVLNRREYNREYYKKNKGRRKKNFDIEKNRAYQRKWQQEHKESRHHYYKNYKHPNIEKKRESGRKWARNNKDKILMYLKKYQSTEKYRQYLERTRNARTEKARKRYAEDPVYRRKLAESQKKWRTKNKAIKRRLNQS